MVVREKWIRTFHYKPPPFCRFFFRKRRGGFLYKKPKNFRHLRRPSVNFFNHKNTKATLMIGFQIARGTPREMFVWLLFPSTKTNAKGNCYPLMKLLFGSFFPRQQKSKGYPLMNYFWKNFSKRREGFFIRGVYSETYGCWETQYRNRFFLEYVFNWKVL